MPSRPVQKTGPSLSNEVGKSMKVHSGAEQGGGGWPGGSPGSLRISSECLGQVRDQQRRNRETPTHRKCTGFKNRSKKALGGSCTCHPRYQGSRSGIEDIGKEKRQQTRGKRALKAPHMES